MTNTLNQARKLYQTGKLDAALSAYQAILSEAPESVEALHAVAVIYARLDKASEALKTIAQAIKLDNKDPSLLNSKANILLRLNKIDAAADCYNDAIKLNPNYATAYTGLGKLFYQQEKFSLAEKSLKKALTLNPHHTEACYNYALVLIQQKKLTKAIEQLEKVLARHANFTAALGQIGELYLETDQADKALPYLDRRVELEPEHVEANHSLAQALAMTHDFEAACQYYEKTLMLDAKHPEANHNLANTYVKLHQNEKAINYYLRQLENNPLAESYYNVGVLMMYLERNKDAIQYLESAQKMNPKHVPTYLNLGAIYLKLKNLEQAITSYKEALGLNPDDEETRYIIDALSNNETPKRAPNAYLQSLFDQYALHYDKHLEQFLEYRVPQQLKKILIEETNLDEATWTVLDLGCGTGLSGEAFKDFSNTLIGVDISENMIDAAKHKEIYQDLIVNDIESALTEFTDINLVIAADVFTYIGDLEPIFSGTSKALKQGGYFTFSVERTFDRDFQVQKTLRYAHAKTYIEKLALQHGFKVLRCDNAILRKQQKVGVEGYLFLLQAL